MRLVSLFLLIYFAGLFSLKAKENISPSIHDQLDQQLIKNSQRYGIAGQSVLLLKNNQVIYQGQQGFANLELAVPVAEHHIFSAYSVTKLFTSVLMMQLVEEGSVDVKKSIRYYLPFLPVHWQQVTVEHALNHTSGIPRYFDAVMEKGRFLASKKAVFLSLADAEDHFEIGTMNKYNNTNFLILSAILEAKTGKSYQELVASKIVQPLKLKNTGHASALAVIGNMVTNYQGMAGQIRKNKEVDWSQYSYAHSGLYSTPRELATFMTALVSQKFVSRESLKKMWQPMTLLNGQSGYYAFGFEYALRDGYQQVGHDGGNRVKLRHYFKEEPGAGDSYTLVYMTNGSAYSVWTDILADSLMSIIEPKIFKQAELTEYFMTEVLKGEEGNLPALFKRITRVFAGDSPAIENFVVNRAYAVRYGAGAKASIPAFEMLTEKFPDSAHSWRRLGDLWQTLGNKDKALEHYRHALAIDPGLVKAKKQIAVLTQSGESKSR
ncbi:serine hydrolase [Thalassomonas actiniarum]|uniref:Serine hydrolase n=1 Tax=Thalassomonas actiniarum TaxID=485447 RepID=A0AAF0C380_9GAMM|nr:serine hydrolase [Thalassomonas actiniarum]WDE00927.1 serine hydrolase [Thalassomonas actiniarum]